MLFAGLVFVILSLCSSSCAAWSLIKSPLPSKSALRLSRSKPVFPSEEEWNAQSGPSQRDILPTIAFEESKYVNRKQPVFVVGGRNGVGYHVIQRLCEMGVPVHVLARRVESIPLLFQLRGVQVFQGEATDAEAAQRCMQGCVAVVAALCGGEVEGQKERVEYGGNSNVIEQAGILGVERIVLVSSIGCGASEAALWPDLHREIKPSIDAKSKAERDLKMYTNLDWTIVRPGTLKNGEATGQAKMTEDAKVMGFVRRQDAASCIVNVLGSDRCTRKEISLVDPSITKAKNEDEEEYFKRDFTVFEP